MKKQTFTKKLTAVLCVSALLLGAGAYAYASQDSALSETLNGTYRAASSDGTKLEIATDQGNQSIALAKSVWVFRNDAKASLSELQAGDRLEIIYNSKHQAAYVKAESGTAAQQQASAAPSPTGAENAQSTTAAAPALPTPASTPIASSVTATPQDLGQAESADHRDWSDLDVSIEGSHFSLKLKQMPGNDGEKADLKLKAPRSGTVHLKDSEASAWIANLLASVDLRTADAKANLLQQIAGQYGLDASGLNIKMDVKWQERQNGSADKSVQSANQDRGASPAPSKQTVKSQVEQANSQDEQDISRDEHGKSQDEQDKNQDEHGKTQNARGKSQNEHGKNKDDHGNDGRGGKNGKKEND